MEDRKIGQKQEVVAILKKDGRINAQLVESEVDWFFE